MMLNFARLLFGIGSGFTGKMHSIYYIGMVENYFGEGLLILQKTLTFANRYLLLWTNS